MPTELSLDALWDTSTGCRTDLRRRRGARSRCGVISRTRSLPARRLANAVRLRMHGEIKLGRVASVRGRTGDRRQARHDLDGATRLFGVPITGYDRYIDGNGEMRWKALGMIPFMSASGPDISRSAAGRLASESMWLPSMLERPGGVMECPADPSHIVAQMPFPGRTVAMTLTLGHLRQHRADRRFSAGAIRIANPSPSAPSAASSKTSERSTATRYRQGSVLAGMSAPSGSSAKESSSAARSTRRSSSRSRCRRVDRAFDDAHWNAPWMFVSRGWRHLRARELVFRPGSV